MLCGLCWDWGHLEVSSEPGWIWGRWAWVYGLPRTEMLTFLDIFLLILTNPLEMSTEGD